MGLIQEMGAFFEGIQSVLNVPEIARHSISQGISDGIDRGIEKNKTLLEKTALKLAIFVSGFFFILLGLAKFGDYFSQIPGLGFILVGCIGILIWALFKNA